MAKSSTTFKPGSSGNKAGKPVGTTHRAKFRAMVNPDMPDLVKAVMTAAKNGDMTAARIIMDRVIPSLRPTSDNLDLRTTGSLAKRGEAILAALTSGRVSPESARVAMSVIVDQSKLIEQSEVLTRIESLENLICPDGKP